MRHHVVGAGVEFGRWVSIVDVSHGGLTLRLLSHVEPGTVLLLEQPAGHRCSRPMLAIRVVHATAMGEGGWLVGCEFASQLNEQELAAMRRPVETRPVGHVNPTRFQSFGMPAVREV
jgi:hypothetical protein